MASTGWRWIRYVSSFMCLIAYGCSTQVDIYTLLARSDLLSYHLIGPCAISVIIIVLKWASQIGYRLSLRHASWSKASLDEQHDHHTLLEKTMPVYADVAFHIFRTKGLLRCSWCPPRILGTSAIGIVRSNNILITCKRWVVMHGKNN